MLHDEDWVDRLILALVVYATYGIVVVAALFIAGVFYMVWGVR